MAIPAKTVLLLDDEVELLGLLSRLLERRGYSVLNASLPEQAIQMARENRGRIGVLVADVSLPRISGVQAASLLRQESPSLGVILISGCPLRLWKGDDVDALQRLGRESVQILVKPFTLDTLLKAIVGSTVTTSTEGFRTGAP
jgi:two-component system, cell cycle sensor histidine kinase and response regulator CckA